MVQDKIKIADLEAGESGLLDLHSMRLYYDEVYKVRQELERLDVPYILKIPLSEGDSTFEYAIIDIDEVAIANANRKFEDVCFDVPELEYQLLFSKSSKLVICANDQKEIYNQKVVKACKRFYKAAQSGQNMNIFKWMD